MQERRVGLFKNGQNQAVRIPREFELPGHEAIMRRDGERLIIEPVAGRSLLALLDRWEDDLSDDEAFPEIEDRPPEPVDI
jgi:antitoxin VapB